jgi:hypothetical protein
LPDDLVGKKQIRFVRQSDGYRYSLRLAAGELSWKVIHPVHESKLGQQLSSPRCGAATRDKAHGKFHILDSGQKRDQVVGLQDKADPLGAKARPVVIIQLIQLLPADRDVAGIGTHQPSNQ